MTLIKNLLDCSTYSVRGLDDQMMFYINQLSPGLMSKLDTTIPNLVLGQAVHPWLQTTAKNTLEKAVKANPTKKLIINSALRTLAGQQLLRCHYENRRCGIVSAAQPGMSNHNNASAIDIENANSWKPILQVHGWRWIGAFDPMHFDCIASGIRNMMEISIKAFQLLYNEANPDTPIAVDGDFGTTTQSKLLNSPAEGFGDLVIARVMKLTQPLQSGNDVGKLQLALRSAGITVEVADQIFGEDTDRAVKEYQAANNLVVDGIVGAGTRALLELDAF